MTKLRALREAQGLSRNKLANISGVCILTLQKIEEDRANPRKDTLEDIAKVLGVKWWEIYAEN